MGRRDPEQYLHETLGLVYLPALTRNLPWAKAALGKPLALGDEHR